MRQTKWQEEFERGDKPRTKARIEVSGGNPLISFTLAIPSSSFVLSPFIRIS